MIELISILCSLLICIITPIEVNKIRGGWVNKRFENNREKFLEVYRKQLRMLTWLGVGFGTLTLALVLIESNPGEKIVKLVAAAICFVQRGRLPETAA
jgi:hypothetical protein